MEAPRLPLIEVIEGDCLDVALKLASEAHEVEQNDDGDGEKEAKNEASKDNGVLVLIMANAQNPGGGFMEGDAAQEESIFRRTSIVQSMGPTNPGVFVGYPLPEFGGVYAPNVSVFRESEEKGYAWMEKIQLLSFVAVAAYARPLLLSTTSKNLEEEECAAKKRKRVDSEKDKSLLKRARIEREAGAEAPQEEYWLPHDIAKKTKKKIRSILDVAKLNGHR